jgi:hypothetical protein
MMRDEIEAALARIGGEEMVDDWRKVDATTAEVLLPSAKLDALGLGYAMALGSLGAIIDVTLDAAFRAEMTERHRYDLGREAELKAQVNQRLKDLGVYPEGSQPNMAMDWYQDLGASLALPPAPFESPDPQSHGQQNRHRDAGPRRGGLWRPPVQALPGHE